MVLWVDPQLNYSRRIGLNGEDEAITSFQALKQAIVTTPVPTLLDFSLPFILERNASGYGMGDSAYATGEANSFHE